MANPPKKKRNELLVQLKDEGHTFREIAGIFNITVRAAWEIYQRETGRLVDKSEAETS